MTADQTVPAATLAAAHALLHALCSLTPLPRPAWPSNTPTPSHSQGAQRQGGRQQAGAVTGVQGSHPGSMGRSGGPCVGLRQLQRAAAGAQEGVGRSLRQERCSSGTVQLSRCAAAGTGAGAAVAALTLWWAVTCSTAVDCNCWNRCAVQAATSVTAVRRLTAAKQL